MTAPYQIVIVIIISVQAIPLSVLKEHKSVLLLEGIICNKDFRVPNGNEKRLSCSTIPNRLSLFFFIICHVFCGVLYNET